MPKPSLLAPLSTFIAPSKRLLVITGAAADIDTLATATVLGKALVTKDRTVTVASLATLPEPLIPLVPLETDLTPFRSLQIRLGVKAAPLQEFTYDVKDDELKIELLSKSGAWSEKDVRVEPGALRFDAVIAINVAAPQEAAALLPSQPEWITTVPCFHLNTATDTSSETKGTISIPATSSLSEETYAWLKEQPIAIDKDAAHNLLTGLIAATNGFRSEHLQAETLERAAELIELGADRQAIMNRLWRVQSVPTLNLWGRALMRLAIHPTLPLAHTVLSENDFLQAKTNEDALPPLGKYLLDRLPEQKFCLILSAWNGKQNARLFAREPFDIEAVKRGFPDVSGSGKYAEWPLKAADLLEAQREALAVLERELPRLLTVR